MALIDFTREVPLSQAQAWDRVTAFSGHGRFVPLTTVTLIDPNAPGGGGFIARTAFGGVGFDDVNVLEIWRPPTDSTPGLCQLRKTGRLVSGWARITVSSTPVGSQIRWQETIELWGVPRLAAPVVAAAGSKMFGAVVDGLMRA